MVAFGGQVYLWIWFGLACLSWIGFDAEGVGNILLQENQVKNSKHRFSFTWVGSRLEWGEKLTCFIQTNFMGVEPPLAHLVHCTQMQSDIRKQRPFTYLGRFHGERRHWITRFSNAVFLIDFGSPISETEKELALDTTSFADTTHHLRVTYAAVRSGGDLCVGTFR